MAGYIFNLDSIEALQMYVTNGVYSTKLSTPKGIWRAHHEATFADYATMKAGDNVYFFINRKIYGIGRLVELVGQDCKFSNYPGACHPTPYQYTPNNNLLWDEGPYSIDQRWLCVFEPDPHFFVNGIDMDDVLASNPKAFKMLRAFWKVSFIKFDDEENQAFRDVLLKFNEAALRKGQAGEDFFDNNCADNHRKLIRRIASDNYRLEIAPFLETCNEKGYLRHEMAIEAGLLFQLAYRDPATLQVFGTWDYLSHQVIASPFKPIDYMDKMDVFGYRYLPGHRPTKSKYFLAELKKDRALPEDVEQVLKYVDWVKDEYCHNDYSMIEAYLVAYRFGNDVIEYKNQRAKRQYTIGRRPAQSLTWSNLKFIEYSYNQALQLIEFVELS